MASRAIQRWSGKKRGPRVETRVHANRTYAKKRRNWVVPFCQVCEELCADPSDCASGGKIDILTNAVLRAKYGDTVRIVRIVGDLYFTPSPQLENCDASTFVGNRWMRVGLYKQKTSAVDGFIPRAVHPLGCSVDPDSGGDFGDTFALWSRTHNWSPNTKLIFSAVNRSCCSVQDGYTVPAETGDDTTGSSPGVTETVVGGRAAYNVPPITCVPCGDPPECETSLEASVPGTWHVPVNIGKPIVMREDDSLNIYFDWAHVKQCGAMEIPAQDTLRWFGAIRMLVEL